jgi:Fis family transcriptional regulator
VAPAEIIPEHLRNDGTEKRQAWQSIETRGRRDVKRELDNLITQMHSTGIRYEDAVRQFKRQYLLEVLKAHRGNQCKAAEELGMHRNTLSRTMAELDLEVSEIRAGLKRPVRSERLVNGGLRQQVR